MALLLLAAFLSFAVIGRILLQYYFIGDHGVRLAKSTAPTSDILPGVTFVLSFLVSAVRTVRHHFEPLALLQGVDLRLDLLGLHGETFVRYVADTRRYLPF